jgi:hypothetical protein
MPLRLVIVTAFALHAGKHGYYDITFSPLPCAHIHNTHTWCLIITHTYTCNANRLIHESCEQCHRAAHMVNLKRLARKIPRSHSSAFARDLGEN